MTPPGYLVAVDAPLPEPLTYLAPIDGRVVARGQPVHVSLGRRKARGVVVGPVTTELPPGIKIKPITDLDDERPPVPAVYMDWLEWLAKYYIFPLGMIVPTVYPPLSRRTKRAPRKSAAVRDFDQRSAPPTLTTEQTNAIRDIEAKPGFGVHLLFGVTGSGKTEVYLHLLEDIIAGGKQCLVLVPEIALTPQVIERFSRRFPGQVAVLHSGLTPREKTTQWWNVVDGGRKILIGARSALFCPMPHLGLIILDEEHEPSYKQDEQLKYHARDAAIVLAKNLNVPIVLGSATPSLETWANVTAGKYHCHRLAERVNARPLPTLQVVDLRETLAKRRDEPSSLPFWMSDELHHEMEHVFAKNEQAALFLNRRGLAQTAQCRACGFKVECPNCSVALTLHHRSHLVCHYCDYSERLREICPDCKASPLEALGLGTERLEEDMRTLFPDARLARADRDEVQSREDLERLIDDVEQHRVNLLIGTQMIAKGLDFPKLNLVGLVLADLGFHWPDFRASERSYQLLTQVSGRSGRQTPGRVVIQTYDPDHPSIRFATAGTFGDFAEFELTERRELNYPPCWRMAMFRITSADAARGEDVAEQLVRRAVAAREHYASFADAVQILGPAPAPLHKLRNKYRYQVIVKGDGAPRLNAFCRRVLGDGAWVPAGTKVQIDIDPFAMM